LQLDHFAERSGFLAVCGSQKEAKKKAASGGALDTAILQLAETVRTFADLPPPARDFRG
jgi:hypothetical protein